MVRRASQLTPIMMPSPSVATRAPTTYRNCVNIQHPIMLSALSVQNTLCPPRPLRVPPSLSWTSPFHVVQFRIYPIYWEALCIVFGLRYSALLHLQILIHPGQSVHDTLLNVHTWLVSQVLLGLADVVVTVRTDNLDTEGG